MSLITIDFSNIGVVVASDDYPAGMGKCLKVVEDRFLVGSCDNTGYISLFRTAEEICQNAAPKTAEELFVKLRGNVKKDGTYFVMDTSGKRVWISEADDVFMYDRDFTDGISLFFTKDNLLKRLTGHINIRPFKSGQDAKTVFTGIYKNLQEAVKFINQQIISGELDELYIISDGKIAKA